MTESRNEGEKSKEVENAKRVLATLKERRKQKVLIYIACNKLPPQPLPDEEEALYKEIRQVLSKSSAKTNVSRLKVITSVPEVFTAEGRKIGPYKQGEIIELANNNDVEFIIKNKIAEPINQ